MAPKEAKPAKKADARIEIHRDSGSSSSSPPSGYPSLFNPYDPIPGVPHGLEPLHELDAIVICQQFDLTEAIQEFTGFETNICYDVFDISGQRLYFAGEYLGFWNRFGIGHNRPFHIKIVDQYGLDVLIVERDCSYALCWWGGETSGNDLIVKWSDGETEEIIGKVEQQFNCCTPTYEVCDSSLNVQMVIRGRRWGSFCPCSMCCNTVFDLLLPAEKGGKQVGQILKKFKEGEQTTSPTSGAPKYGIRFPPDLDPTLKATLLGATFSIVLTFFERSDMIGKKGDRKFHRSGGSQEWSGCCACVLMFCILFILGAILLYAFT